MAIRVLLAEGNAEAARRVLGAVAREQFAVEWERAGRAALDRLDDGWAALIVGEQPGQEDGAELIAAARGRGFDGAIIGLLNRPDGAAIRRLLGAGAYDVLLRASGYELVLGRLLWRALEQVWLRRRVERLQSDVSSLARSLARSRPTDPLTGLATGWYFAARGRDERRRAARTGRPLARVTVRLSSRSESDAPNAASRQVRLADVLRTQARASDVVGRLAPDMFAVLLPETDPDGGWAFVQRVAAALEAAGEREVGYAVEAEVATSGRRSAA